MKISAILDKQKRNKYFSIASKKAIYLLRQPRETIPVFVFGRQRSGTTMLMNAFHLHRDIEIFDENRNSRAFRNHRIRSFEVVEELVQQSRFTFVCFKPIADSHLATEFIARFPQGCFIWIYRDYRDVANSALKKFPHATRAIRIVCTGQTGGGWFQEGVSTESAEIVREIYSPHLSEFDLLCLAWWVRNRIFIEQKLYSVPNLILTKYEDIATKPNEFFNHLFEFSGLRPDSSIYRFIHPDSISKNVYPEITPAVRTLCEGLMTELNRFA
ncbi:sulfotransferase domain-containing protein [Deltaproteobacteria bacterium IMCC39524]|nr:sulfotransferase domain-containing protein [Deltaproteobacteria bacterium IMCC39524]